MHIIQIYLLYSNILEYSSKMDLALIFKIFEFNETCIEMYTNFVLQNQLFQESRVSVFFCQLPCDNEQGRPCNRSSLRHAVKH